MTFKKSENPKGDRLYCRVTREEKAEIQAKAKDCSIPVSEYILKAALGRQTRTRQDVLTINTLILLGNQIRDLYHAQKPRSADELQPVLDAVVRAIDRIGNRSQA